MLVVLVVLAVLAAPAPSPRFTASSLPTARSSRLLLPRPRLVLVVPAASLPPALRAVLAVPWSLPTPLAALPSLRP